MLRMNRVTNEKNDFGSLAQGSKCIVDQDAFWIMVSGRGHSQVARMMKMKHLKDVKDVNDSGS